LEVSRSHYYEWLQARPSPRDLENQRLSNKIRAIFVEHKCTYGTRRIRKVLQLEGEEISRRRVGKLMKNMGLSCKTIRRFCPKTTDSNHDNPVSPNILNREFTAMEPDQKYVGDITYIWTMEGWLYLAAVIDLFGRRVVGWAMDDHMRASLVNNALLMAITTRKPKAGLVSHTDRGSQYASKSHRLILQEHKIIQSMSRKGNCWDNAVAESFFHTLKTELTHHVTFETREEAKKAIFKYIAVYYNRKRLHSANDYMAPALLEEQHRLSKCA
jgi:transposase InsO family protein